MLSDEAGQKLREVGWVHGRQGDVSAWRDRYEPQGIAMHGAAEKFLAEFGGLVFDLRGPGVSKAREPFVLDPLECDGNEDRFVDWSGRLGRNIFPVGVLAYVTMLGIDDLGRICALGDRLMSFGIGAAAIEKLIVGALPKKLIGY